MTLNADDLKRMSRQRRLVLEAMQGGQWRNLYRLSDSISEPTQSVSMRLREFNYDKWAHLGFRMEKRRVKENGGTWEYRLVPRGEAGQLKLFNAA